MNTKNVKNWKKVSELTCIVLYSIVFDNDNEVEDYDIKELLFSLIKGNQ